MGRSEQLRGAAAWWQRPAVWVRKLRQDPGTTNLRRDEALAERVAARQVEVRELTEKKFTALLAELPKTASDSGLTDDWIVEYLAAASEVAHRELGLTPFKVQQLAAISMLRARVVDMATGEGKTLVGFLVAAGLATAGLRVHVLSANDYLAGRDAHEGEPLFAAFGLSSAAVIDGMSFEERAAAYGSDVVYATMHQVGFDLLRDRQRAGGVQRLVPELDAAVVDEIDAVLVDDAMVPLVIAGDADAQETPAIIDHTVADMTEGEDFDVDGERRNAGFTDSGIKRLERALDVEHLYDEAHVDLLAAAHVALHAHALVDRDVHYIVSNGQVQLINDARGRVADRQRWPDGLHAAIERKEGLAVSGNAQIMDQMLVETVARAYNFLTGMSGTALEAAERLSDDLDVKIGAIPTNQPCVRVDEPDRLYVTQRQRDVAAALRVRKAHRAGQPVLVGSASIGESERFARRLGKYGVEVVVLNAKNDEAEAEIIARAGESGRVTVSTQMAGRGVDIRLDDDAHKAGGLLVVGLGRYDSPRLDQQLRGRSGRQGDPGRSVFYTCIEDPVVTEHLQLNVEPRAVEDDGLISDPKFAQHYAHAQRVAEGKMLSLHRTTRRYHEGSDQHRRTVLDTREKVLSDDDALRDYLQRVWPDNPKAAKRWSAESRRALARAVVLFTLDEAWTGHLNRMAEIREGIHLRALARQDPLDEFNRHAIRDFHTLGTESLERVRETLDDAPEDATTLSDLGLRRPSSTWTYLVTDNPYGAEMDRVVEAVGRAVRNGRPAAVEHK
ncbi:accessory Sec system translocase SecA2 [Cumulibacter soli]|uniref:accessory Sec system translocase SecA2 n=1 Tax=Cumulibacter soli TaxID=2546344 RepID=UPI00106751A8|nr:accessory Sec system translocase SecA2 [Cumulibacter soli]